MAMWPRLNYNNPFDIIYPDPVIGSRFVPLTARPTNIRYPLSLSQLHQQLAKELQDSFKQVDQVFDQHFGETGRADDNSPAVCWRGLYLHANPCAALQQTGTDKTRNFVVNDQANGSEWRVILDVKQFSPQEVQVKLIEAEAGAPARLEVHAKHETRNDEHGTIAREFTRIYTLPNGVKTGEVKAVLGADGLLNVCAPRGAVIEGRRERTISVEMASGPQEPASAERGPEKPGQPKQADPPLAIKK